MYIIERIINIVYEIGRLQHFTKTLILFFYLSLKILIKSYIVIILQFKKNICAHNV